MAFRELTTARLVERFGCHYDTVLRRQQFGPGAERVEEGDAVQILAEAEQDLQRRLGDAQAQLAQEPVYQKALRARNRLNKFIESGNRWLWISRQLIGQETARTYLQNIEQHLERIEARVRYAQESLERGIEMIPAHLVATVPNVGDTLYVVRTDHGRTDLEERMIVNVSVNYYGSQDENIYVRVDLDAGSAVSWVGVIDSNQIEENTGRVHGRGVYLTREAAVEALEHHIANVQAQLDRVREELNS